MKLGSEPGGKGELGVGLGGSEGEKTVVGNVLYERRIKKAAAAWLKTGLVVRFQSFLLTSGSGIVAGRPIFSPQTFVIRILCEYINK